MFDQKEICEYEEKTGNGKNWTNTKKYFITLIKQKQQYTKTLQSYQGGGYESANSFGETSSVTSSGTSLPPLTLPQPTNDG